MRNVDDSYFGMDVQNDTLHCPHVCVLQSEVRRKGYDARHSAKSYSDECGMCVSRRQNRACNADVLMFRTWAVSGDREFRPHYLPGRIGGCSLRSSSEKYKLSAEGTRTAEALMRIRGN